LTSGGSVEGGFEEFVEFVANLARSSAFSVSNRARSSKILVTQHRKGTRR
jgi:hypothetical protein